MRKGIIGPFIILGVIIFSVAFIHKGASAQGDAVMETGPVKKLPPPGSHGTVLMDRNTRDLKDIRPVLFPHWSHRTRYTCNVCHIDLAVPMKSNTQDIRQADLEAGKNCGKCHDGETSFSVKSDKDCLRCHSYGIEVRENKKIEDELKDFKKDDYGYPDWASAVRSNLIKPLASLDGKKTLKVMEESTIIPVTKLTIAPPDVLFPHKVHTLQMDCAMCHPSPFKDKNGANPDMNMMRIISGQYCGVCHGKVSFPLGQCYRCHSQPGIRVQEEEPKKDSEKKDTQKK